MSWATVTGLTAILALAGLAVKIYLRASDKREKAHLEKKIGVYERKLRNALSKNPSNIAFHAQLRASLRRLQEQLDALG